MSVKGYNDITPRMGVAYDLFGNGKTALKANLGKYLQSAQVAGTYVANNPAQKIVTRITARPWTDGNRNFQIDCNLTDPRLQDNLASGGDRCAALGGNDLNFGNPNPGLTIIDPAILEGWGVRESDWQFGVSVQQEVLPRVGVEVGYNRRWFQNFLVTDNQLIGPADYEPWTMTAPLHPDLPGGGGYPVTLYNPTPTAFNRGAQNFQTFETNFGPARTWYWHGVDVTANARLRRRGHAPGGHEHRTWRAGPLRDRRQHRQPGPARMRRDGAVDHRGPGVGQLHGSESGRAGQRDRSVRCARPSLSCSPTTRRPTGRR